MAEESADADRVRALRFAYEYASAEFGARIEHLEAMRNRSLVALTLMSVAAGLLGTGELTSTASDALWLSVVLIGLAVVFALPPLLSLGVTYPVKLSTLERNAKEFTPEQMIEGLLRDIVDTAAAAEQLSHAIGVYTSSSLMFAVAGLSGLAALVGTSADDRWVRVALGTAAGALACGLILYGRRVLNQAGKAVSRTKLAEGNADVR